MGGKEYLRFNSSLLAVYNTLLLTILCSVSFVEVEILLLALAFVVHWFFDL